MRDASADLIERLESAGEGSRELDVLIYCALPRSKSEWDKRRPSRVEGRAILYYVGGSHGTQMVPHYTTSLDAALTLYSKRPERIPSDARLACLEALSA